MDKGTAANLLGCISAGCRRTKRDGCQLTVPRYWIHRSTSASWAWIYKGDSTLQDHAAPPKQSQDGFVLFIDASLTYRDGMPLPSPFPGTGSNSRRHVMDVTSQVTDEALATTGFRVSGLFETQRTPLVHLFRVVQYQTFGGLPDGIYRPGLTLESSPASKYNCPPLEEPFPSCGAVWFCEEENLMN